MLKKQEPKKLKVKLPTEENLLIIKLKGQEKTLSIIRKVLWIGKSSMELPATSAFLNTEIFMAFKVRFLTLVV